MKRTRFLKIISIVFSAIALLHGVPAHAARLLFDASTTHIRPGSEVEVGLFIDSENESFNAVDARLTFPPSLLSVKEIRTGSSIINFWVEKPHVASSGEVVFSGIIPGGYQSAHAALFSVIFTAKNEGTGTLTGADIKVLKNDGRGTSVKTSTSKIPVEVSSRFKASSASSSVDTTSPEPFVPVISQNPDIFNNQYFVAFATADKQSGISYYEIAESPHGSKIPEDTLWKRSESPYLLSDQTLHSDIYVKAVDGAGNFVVEKISAPAIQTARWKTVLFILLIIVACMLLLRVWKVRRRRKQD